MQTMSICFVGSGVLFGRVRPINGWASISSSDCSGIADYTAWERETYVTDIKSSLDDGFLTLLIWMG
jgi:hypothetical protein